MECQKAGAEDGNTGARQGGTARSKTVSQHASGKLADRVGRSEADKIRSEVRDSRSGVGIDVFAAYIVAGIENPSGEKDLDTRSGQRLPCSAHRGPCMAA